MDYLGDTKRGLLGFSTKSKFQHILETFPLCRDYKADLGFAGSSHYSYLFNRSQ